MNTKINLYINTLKYMKISQIYYRMKRNLKLKIKIGCKAKWDMHSVETSPILQELDYDQSFLDRFNVDEIMNNKVTFLNSSEHFNWTKNWYLKNKSDLWNFNLHYFEYLFPLLNMYKKTHDSKYIDKTVYMIKNWIRYNTRNKGGVGWSSYTIAIRLTNWIDYYSEIKCLLSDDFCYEFTTSIYEQYVYLSDHMEKDLLGNHYFEDLKTIILCAAFFKDERMLNYSIEKFIEQCKEQILVDGMHFELSPMYHKIILEDIIRVAYVLKQIGKDYNILVKEYIQKMLNVAWSLEEGLERVPLFNDSGNNVAKSLNALIQVCNRCFNIIPEYKSQLKDSGYYIFKKDKWKLIVDAGMPGPTYNAGHVHCDAMSFEMFYNGKPILVNCGTYGYQCSERDFFRKTSAHNTVMVNNTEQSECWGAFRLARRSSVKVLSVDDFRITMELYDFKKQLVRREIKLEDNFLFIKDVSINNSIKSFYHCTDKRVIIKSSSKEQILEQKYSENYGIFEKLNRTVCFNGNNMISVKIDFAGIKC